MVSTNPFASRQVRPGAIPFQFTPPDSASQIIDRLRNSHWSGAIVGPHGSGKSTLLETLAPLWPQQGLTEVRVTLHAGGKRTGKLRLPQPAEILVIDGLEQLSWPARRWLIFRCSAAHRRLLATCHAPLGLPIVSTTQPSADLAVQLVELLQATGDKLVTAEDARMMCESHAGDLRETLFQLYHLYESRRKLRAMGDQNANNPR